MKIFKLFLFHSIFLLLFSSMLTTKASTSTPQTHKFEPQSSAFISDFHDVLTKPERQKKAIPAFRAMSLYNKAKFAGRIVQYYFDQWVTSNLWPKEYFKKCNEVYTITASANDQNPNYKDNAMSILNSDTIVPANINFLTAQKNAGAYVAICTNLGPESTKFVNQANQNFLDKLCTNPSDSNSSPAIWTPNGQTNFIKKHYPQSQSYQSLLERIATCKPDTKTIVVLDDKSTNLAAAQAALSRLQQQEPPVLASAKIVPIEIKHPDTFVSTVEKALNITKF